jgi:hypothetical protein
VALTGIVSNGSTPIVGANVYLLAANTTGYGWHGAGGIEQQRFTLAVERVGDGNVGLVGRLCDDRLQWRLQSDQ